MLKPFAILDTDFISKLYSVQDTKGICEYILGGCKETKLLNIRVFDDDVRLLFSLLPSASFDKIFLLFPDPWPKTRHANRRFVNPDNLRELARLLKKGGILKIATDHPVYKKWTLDVMHRNKDFRWTAKCSDDWRYPPADWFETKYQRKAIREGRRPVFFEFERV